jgi:hypothetical protein
MLEIPDILREDHGENAEDLILNAVLKYKLSFRNYMTLSSHKIRRFGIFIHGMGYGVVAVEFLGVVSEGFAIAAIWSL